MALFRRRDLLRAVIVGAGAAAVQARLTAGASHLRSLSSSVSFDTAHDALAAPSWSDGKRKARYRANSAEVQDFYRVNRYPTR